MPALSTRSKLIYGFNPLPTRRSEDAGAPGQGGAVGVVSIHFRPEGRKMLRRACGQVELCRVSIHFRPEGRKMQKLFDVNHKDISFQSTSDPKVGRCRCADQAHSSHNGFQSTPDPKVGRCAAARDSCSPISSFNPLPTRRSEDAYIKSLREDWYCVSIHFRPEGRKMQSVVALAWNP